MLIDWQLAMSNDDRLGFDGDWIESEQMHMGSISLEREKTMLLRRIDHDHDGRVRCC